MSAAEPTASNTIQTLVQEPAFLKFPPFPEPPPDVTIMPFKNFKPRGIQLFSEPKKEKDGSGDEEDAELDALGIPTVELRVKHTTDECKSNPRKKRKKKKTSAVVAGEPVPVKKLFWYDEWEEGEDLRVTKVRYDASTSPADRFFQSAFDFRTGRPWPPVSSGLNNLWDQFRLFTGLLINPSVFRKVGAKKYAREESPNFVSDDEDDTTMNIEDSADAIESRPAKRQRPDEDVDGDEDVPTPDPHKLDEELREEKIAVFLNDPERSVRIFLSSYMREQGLIWGERNLIFMPRLISFFLTFVLRNRVLLEPAYQRGLKRALETIEWAKKELPLTYKVGQSIPDSFNDACRECFGRKGGMNWSVVDASAVTTEQQDASISVTNMANGVKTNITLPTELETQIKDAIEDNVDTEVSLDISSTNVTLESEEAAGGWGGGWGDAGSLDQNAWAQSEPWDDDTQEDQGTTGDTVVNHGPDSKWGDSNPSWNRDLSSLFSLLGPSVFPLTHTTGIVECSTRRVTAVHFPPNHPKAASSPSVQDGLAEASDGLGWAPSACGVEAELDARFAKVVLEPWGREEGDIAGPEIWNTSRGPVIDPKKLSKKGSINLKGSTSRKPHDPLTDKITLLVDTSFAETLSAVPGLGLGAMWIEIARLKNGAGTTAEVDTSTPGRFWYHEDVTGIFPSFYTPRDKE